MAKDNMEDYKKKYEDIIEKVKNLLNKSKDIGVNIIRIQDIEDTIPEIVESDDERIRKELIEFVDINTISIDERRDRWIAWLEKRGEKNTISKIPVSEKLYEHIRNICACIDDAMSSESIFDVKNYIEQASKDTQDAFDMIEKQGEKGTNGNEREIPNSEQKPSMIQWKGDNLKEVIAFTGKAPQFDKWFKTFDEYEQYVYNHNKIFKLFNEDGNHYEVPVGAWIVRTPDGCNVASRAVFKQKPAEWSEEDKCIYDSIIHDMLGDLALTPKQKNWLKALKDRVGCEVNCTTTKDWNEEDEGMLNSFLHKLEVCDILSNKEIIWIKNKLKSLISQNRWKPTRTQTDSLGVVIKHPDRMTEFIKKELTELLEQLKKLQKTTKQ